MLRVHMFDLAITLTSKDCVSQAYVPSINAGWLPAFAYFCEIHCKCTMFGRVSDHQVYAEANSFTYIITL